MDTHEEWEGNCTTSSTKTESLKKLPLILPTEHPSPNIQQKTCIPIPTKTTIQSTPNQIPVWVKSLQEQDSRHPKLPLTSKTFMKIRDQYLD